MKRSLALAIALLAVGCGEDVISSPSAASSIQNPVSYQVSGAIRDELGQPVEGAYLHFYITKFRQAAAYTDPSGTYRAQVQAGNYLVTITRSGYRLVSRTVDVLGNTALDFTLTRS